MIRPLTQAWNNVKKRDTFNLPLNLTEAFAKFNAKLTNNQWAVSAISDKNELVISCWSHLFVKKSNPLRYEDHLSRWKGNVAGNNQCKSDLKKAFDEGLKVCLVIVTSDELAEINNKNEVKALNKHKKTFAIREDLIGKVTLFDGDNFVIEFEKKH